MFISPLNLRSGPKGKPVKLSTSDKQNLQLSLSESSEISSGMTSTMPEINNQIDPAFIKSAIKSHLSSDGVLTELISQLTEKFFV